MARTSHTALRVNTDDEPDTETRAGRAQSEEMVVIPVTDGDGEAAGDYRVETEGGVYSANLSRGTCTCPDHKFNKEVCKHLRRAAIRINTDESDLPAPGEHIGDYREELRDKRASLRATVRLLRGRAESDGVSDEGAESLRERADGLADMAATIDSVV